MATLGYVRSSNGPDLAQVGVNEQLVSHVFPNTTGQTLRLTHVSAWVGNWSGQATIRFGVWAASSSSAAPGALLARTQEVNPSVSYVDGAGGQLVTAYLEMPIDLAPGQVICLGIASRNHSAGIAMYEAADISQPNENFYRKNIAGTTLDSASGSAASNEGHLAIAVTGTVNVAPNAPTSLDPNQPDYPTPIGRWPFLSFIHTDPNGDNASHIWMQVQTASGSQTLWDFDTSTSIADGARAGVTYRPSAGLNFYTDYRWRAKVRDSNGADGPWSGWAYFSIRHANSSPNLPSNTGGNRSLYGSLTFTAQADFTDPDYPLLPDGQPYETFSAKRVRVTRVSDNAQISDSGVVATTTAERNAARSSTSITLPAWDVEYRIHESHRDRAGAWSEEVTYRVTAKSGASVDAPTSPKGRITNWSNPGNIVAVYRNTAALNATRWRVGLFSKGGTLIEQSSILTVNVARNNPYSVSWPTAGFGVPTQGETFQVRSKAMASNGVWSDWSDPTFFTMNARPDTPGLWGPVNGQVRSTIPPLGVVATDADQPANELSVQIEGYDASDNLISAHTATHAPHPSNDDVFSLGTPHFVSGYGTYKWRSRVYDGYLFSNWSPLWTFTYAAVPAVSISAPAGPTITTSQPQLGWDSAGQTAWRVVGRNNNGDTVYDTGVQSGGAQSHIIQQVQYWVGRERWNNHETFSWTVLVQDASTLWGESDALTLTLEYIEPDPLILNGEALAFVGIGGTHYAGLAHSQSNYPEGEFLAYVWDRAEIDGPAGNEIPGTYIDEYARITNSADTVLTDFDVTSNQWYRWGVRQEIKQGLDIITSAPVYVELMVSWHGTLLHMPFDPINNVVWLNYGANEYRPRRERVALASGSAQPSGYRAPIGYTGSARQTNPSGEYTFIANNAMDHMQQLDVLDRMYEYQFADASPDGRPHVLCWREGRGGRKGRLYVFLADWEDSPSVGRTTQAVTLQFEERHYQLGVSAGDDQ